MGFYIGCADKKSNGIWWNEDWMSIRVSSFTSLVVLELSLPFYLVHFQKRLKSGYFSSHGTDGPWRSNRDYVKHKWKEGENNKHQKGTSEVPCSLPTNGTKERHNAWYFRPSTRTIHLALSGKEERWRFVTVFRDYLLTYTYLRPAAIAMPRSDEQHLICEPKRERYDSGPDSLLGISSHLEMRNFPVIQMWKGTLIFRVDGGRKPLLF